MAKPSPTTPSRSPFELAGQMAGEYRLGRLLGEGGFGAVYEAEHPVLKRRAAVKVLHRAAAKDSDALLRFIAEAQAVNQIRSPHIVDIFSFGQLADGRHFYVMDLLDGEALDRQLARVGRFPVGTALQILAPIATALDVAHAAGIVHRDLKPQNIFLAFEASGEAVPKLLDFGVAKLLVDSAVKTVSGTPIGTPLYMSPEQARGDKVDARSDVYALGVVFHELITGACPIQADGTLGLLMAHIIKPPTAASQACPDIPPLLDAPILRMLEKQADKRPATAGEALRAIADAAAQAGLPLATGLPRLTRPEPTSTLEGDLALTRTLERSHAGAADSRDPREGWIRSIVSVRSASHTRWAVLSLLGVVVVGATVALYGQSQRATTNVTAGAQHGTTAPAHDAHTESAVQGSTVQPASAPPTSLPRAGVPLVPVAAEQVAPRPAESAAEDSGTAPVERAAPAKRAPRARSRAPSPAIPRDLESPF